MRGVAQAIGSEAWRAGGTGMLFSDPGDEAQWWGEESGVGLVELKYWWDTHVKRVRGQSVG